MRLTITAFLLLTFALSSIAGGAGDSERRIGVRIVPNQKANKVDILFDGRPFTTYTWTDKLKTPVLNPLRTANGTIITRGFPLEPRAGERVDHPHHVGMWFNYGDVNGVDFWNNSTALPPERQKKMGTVLHRRVALSDDKKNELRVEADWVMPDGDTILRETTIFSFTGGPKLRVIDRTTKLSALDKPVVFRDNKEGLLGIRVRRELEHPTKEPLVFTDASGQPTQVKVMDNTGVSGLYRSSEGKTGDDVWGTRGRWTMLTGKIDDESITVAILDHPKNPGFPTFWHARGYGLFAANPLGQAVFSSGKQKLELTLESGQSVIFRYRVSILSEVATAEQMESHWRQFATESN